jgi:hypothetical protein
MSQRIDGCHCTPSKILLLLPSFKLNFVLPMNVFALGLRVGFGLSPEPFLPFFQTGLRQTTVRSPSFAGLRSYHSSKSGLVRWLYSRPLQLGFNI